jgi:hypothetical protein
MKGASFELKDCAENTGPWTGVWGRDEVTGIGSEGLDPEERSGIFTTAVSDWRGTSTGEIVGEEADLARRNQKEEGESQTSRK